MEKRTILVVEDEKPILRLIQRSLARVKGYKVLVAVTASDGLLTGLDRRAHIDLLLSNVELPGMSGSELAFRIKVARPSMRVILVDGKENGDLAILARETGWIVLRKPKTGEALLERVRAELESAAARPAMLKRRSGA